MFETIIVKRLKPESVEFNHPKYIRLNSEDYEENQSVFEIYKGAEKYLYKRLNIKPNTSKEVYKLSESIWKQLIDKQIRECEEDEHDKFSLNDDKTIYLCSEDRGLVDIFKISNEEELENFEQKLEKYVIDITTTEKTKKFFTDSKDDTLKLVCYDSDADLPNEEYTPVVLMELNVKKSIYKVYTGIIIYNNFTFIPSLETYMDTDVFNRFIRGFDLNDCLDYSKENAENVYTTYRQLLDNDTEISVRELLHLMNSVGYKIALSEDNQIGEIKNLNDEENNLEIQNFFNTFNLVTNESAVEVLSLTELQKIFRYNKLTFMEVLRILSKEYLEYEGSKVTASKLGEIIINLFNRTIDKKQAEIIKNEIKE